MEPDSERIKCSCSGFNATCGKCDGKGYYYASKLSHVAGFYSPASERVKQGSKGKKNSFSQIKPKIDDAFYKRKLDFLNSHSEIINRKLNGISAKELNHELNKLRSILGKSSVESSPNHFAYLSLKIRLIKIAISNFRNESHCIKSREKSVNKKKKSKRLKKSEKSKTIKVRGGRELPKKTVLGDLPELIQLKANISRTIKDKPKS